MKSIEKVGKTVDSAVTEALIELGATTDEVNVEVINKGSRGIFGIGAKMAQVRVTIKENVIDPIEEELKKEIDEVSTLKQTISPQVNPVKVIKESKVIKEETEKEETEKVTPSQKDEYLVLARNNAEKFLNEVLEAMGVEAKLIINTSKGKLNIDITGEKMGMIIGKRGETLDSLQYLTNIVVNKGEHSYVKVMLDTENYRARREETLRKLAHKLAKKATQTRKPVVLEPMNPYDRRIIHSSLQNNRSIKTHSEGKEPFRKVIITSTLSKSSNKR